MNIDNNEDEEVFVELTPTNIYPFGSGTQGFVKSSIFYTDYMFQGNRFQKLSFFEKQKYMLMKPKKEKLLIKAAANGDINEVRRLIPNCNMSKEKGYALYAACVNGNMECFKELLTVSHVDGFFEDHSDIIKKVLFSFFPENTSFFGLFSETPYNTLLVLIKNKQYEAITLVADCYSQEKIDHALMYANAQGNEDIVKYLLEKTDSDQTENLETAVRMGAIELINLFLPKSVVNAQVMTSTGEEEVLKIIMPHWDPEELNYDVFSSVVCRDNTPGYKSTQLVLPLITIENINEMIQGLYEDEYINIKRPYPYILDNQGVQPEVPFFGPAGPVELIDILRGEIARRDKKEIMDGLNQTNKTDREKRRM